MVSVPSVTPVLATASEAADVEISSPGRIQLAIHKASPLITTRTMKERIPHVFTRGQAADTWK